MRGLTLDAPAKVNLFLEITGRRPDGYHTLETVFAKLGLADTLTLKAAEKPSLRVVDRSPTPVPPGPGNLVLKAAAALGRPAAMRLVKRVPSGAGLGGGSSDAASALLGLSKLYGLRRPLLPAARRLGADVPFFLRPEPLALGRGIGDRLRPLKSAGGPWWAVVVYPGKGVSTKEAYSKIKLRRGTLTTRRLLDRLTRSLRAGAPPSVWTPFLFNRFEEPVFKMCPESARARRALDAQGARARLSGSGSCVFAVAPDQAAARRWARGLGQRPNWAVFVTRLG